MKLCIPQPGQVLVLNRDQNISVVMDDSTKNFFRKAMTPEGFNRTCNGDSVSLNFKGGTQLTVIKLWNDKLVLLHQNDGRFWIPTTTELDFEIRPIEPKLRFYLQNRYQDSGWEDCDEDFDTLKEALAAAADHAEHSIIYGMTRVWMRRPCADPLLILEIPAGGYS